MNGRHGSPNGALTCAATRSASPVATTTVVPLTSYAPYSKSGWKAIARFDGIVHGVVVQMRTESCSRPARPGTRCANSRAASGVNGNSTKIDGDV